jgi:hypothetical protein
MSEIADTPAQIMIPPDVRRFALEHSLAENLPGIIGLTQRLYPGGDISLRLEEDAETADDWYIVLDVDIADLDGNQLATLQWQWCVEVINYCPSTHTHFVRLGWKAPA